MLVYGQLPAGAKPDASWPQRSLVGGVAVPLEQPGNSGGKHFIWADFSNAPESHRGDKDFLDLCTILLEVIQ